MKLSVIGSGSTGNAYILETANEILLLECGVNFKEIKQAISFNLKKVVGCLVTHEHKDHCKSLNEVMDAGINVYATDGTLRTLGKESHHRAITTFHGDDFRVGSFRVMPFSIEHDVAEPVGFIIYHEECGKILFITDSCFCKWTFKGLNNIIIEANYAQDIVDERVRTGSVDKNLRDRVLDSHMSLKTCKEMLAANDLSKVNNIVLIHLSDKNSDEKRFKREIEEQTGKAVYVATAGLVINPFNLTPF